MSPRYIHFTMRRIFYGSIIFVFFAGCRGMERSEQEKLKKRNCTGEYIYRGHKDFLYPIAIPEFTPRPVYPWEANHHLPRITKDFFRCRGSTQNPQVFDILAETQATLCSDCEGGSLHGLPVLNGREGVYPILLDLLNYIQNKTGKRIVITSGHRCPAHNIYVDSSKENRTSKHQIGAEVDFYVQGMEDHPQEIVGLLLQYYQETPFYEGKKEYQAFSRYEKPDARVSIQPWMNKEIYIKLNQREEGRNFDNRHPHPYITLQVRFDREKSEKVVYDWAKANKGYVKGW